MGTALGEHSTIESPTESSRHRRIAIALIVVGVGYFVLRGANRLLYPVLYAEDGRVLFFDSVMQGFGALFEPHAGYLNSIGRIVAWVVSPLLFTAIPLAYVVGSIVVYLVVAAHILSPRLAWLLPTRVARATAFALLCALPPLVEAYGNLINLLSVGPVAIVLIGLMDDPRTGRAASPR